MEKVRACISEMPNRCKLVVESSGRARYSNIEEEFNTLECHLSMCLCI